MRHCLTVCHGKRLARPWQVTSCHAVRVDTCLPHGLPYLAASWTTSSGMARHTGQGHSPLRHHCCPRQGTPQARLWQLGPSPGARFDQECLSPPAELAGAGGGGPKGCAAAGGGGHPGSSGDQIPTSAAEEANAAASLMDLAGQATLPGVPLHPASRELRSAAVLLWH